MAKYNLNFFYLINDLANQDKRRILVVINKTYIIWKDLKVSMRLKHTLNA